MSVPYLKLKLKTFHLDLMLSTFWLKSISYERGGSEVVSFFLTQTLAHMISEVYKSTIPFWKAIDVYFC